MRVTSCSPDAGTGRHAPGGGNGHQRAHRAFAGGNTRARKAVVDDEDDAFGQPLAKRAHPGARREPDLALIGRRHLIARASSSSSPLAGFSAHASSPSRNDTPLSMTPRSVQATACTGIASTTSLAMIVRPRQRLSSAMADLQRVSHRSLGGVLS